jgi:hypothetical protein
MSIEESVEYRHLTAQGLPPDVAWGTVWIDRAYNHLVRNGMGGAEAYAQATSTWAANCTDMNETTPEAAIAFVLKEGFDAQQKFPSLDPKQPAASFMLQHRPLGQGEPS